MEASRGIKKNSDISEPFPIVFYNDLFLDYKGKSAKNWTIWKKADPNYEALKELK